MNKQKTYENALNRLNKEIEYYQKEKKDIENEIDNLNENDTEYETKKKHLSKRLAEIGYVIKEVELKIMETKTNLE